MVLYALVTHGGASAHVSIVLDLCVVGDIPDGDPHSEPVGGEGKMVEGGLQVMLETPNILEGKDPYGGKLFSWWFFTWNNPPHDEGKKSLLKAFGKGKNYCKFQYEKGKEGTLHYQGVIYVQIRITARALQQSFSSRAYLAPVINTEAALRYCGKADTRIAGPWTAGKLPAQGQRSDLLECKSIIDNGGGVVELYDKQFSNMIRYGRGLRNYIEVAKGERKRTWHTTCYVYFGDTGMGKSEAVKAEIKEWGGADYWLTLEGGMSGKVWWGDEYRHYNGEPNVVIDEFEQQMRLSDLKRLIDHTPLEVPYKGGYTPFLARRVWILTNYPAHEWYARAAPIGPPRNALYRRIHYYEEFMERYRGLKQFRQSRRFFVMCQRDGTYDIHAAPRPFLHAPVRNAFDMPILNSRRR